MKTLYLLAGCKGAGKTTAAYTLLPDVLPGHDFWMAELSASLRRGTVVAQHIHDFSQCPRTG